MTPIPIRLRLDRSFFHAAIVFSGSAALLLAGCLAQQAELTQVERNLGTRIAKLDQREKDLQQSISLKEKELQQAINKAKVELDRQVSEARARLSQEISTVRETDLPSMQGGLDKSIHQIGTLRNRIDDIEHQMRAGLEGSTKRLGSLEKVQNEAATATRADRERLHDELKGETTKRFDAVSGRLDTMTTTIGTMAKTLGGRLDEYEKVVHANDSKGQQVDAQARQLESQNHTLIEQMAQYKKALEDFKKALNGLGEKVVQEEQRTNELSAKLLGRADMLSAKVETDTKATTSHLQDVNKSVGSVARALETMGGQVMTRVEEQDRRLDEMVKSLSALDAQVGSVTRTISQVRMEREQASRGGSKAREDAPTASSHEASAPVDTVAAPSQNGHAAAPVDSSSASTRDAAGGLPHAREVYDRHITAFKQGNLDTALHGFTQFLTQYPTSELAPNAQYWLGECYYGKGDYARAIEAFDRVKMVYSASEKVPAALLKKGFAYLALKDRSRASSVWRQVVDGYPKTPEAGKAMEKLAQLKQLR